VKSIQSISLKALAWDFSGTFVMSLFSFVISIVLARLIAPEIFGVIAAGIAVVLIFQSVQEMGFSSVLIQDSKVDDLSYSSVFWLNVLFGVCSYIFLFASASFFSQFFAIPELLDVIRLLALILLFNSLNVVQSAILKKALDFKKLVLRDLIAKVISGGAAITLAVYGYGIYALLAQLIIQIIVKTILLWKVTRWRPEFQFSLVEIKRLSRFSFFVFLSQLFNQIMKQSDAMLIGKLFSASTLGLYSRATSVSQTFISSFLGGISKIAFPALSKIKDDRTRASNAYLKMMDSTAVVSFMLAGILYLSSSELIIFLYGNAWEKSIPLFEILIFRAMMVPINSISINMFLASGKAESNFYFSFVRRGIRIIPIVIGVYLGLMAFLYSLVVVSVLIGFLNMIFAHYSLQIGLRLQLRNVAPMLVINALVLFLIYWSASIIHVELALWLELIVYSTIYLSALYIFSPVVFNDLLAIVEKLINSIRKRWNA
jgi:O-antigen/teichoic acid export membrane protein